MHISSCGGVIAAANERSAFPLSRVGNTTAVKRIVTVFQQAGIFPIVVISGSEEDEVRYQLSSSGVVFLRPEEREPELFDSVKTGLSFLQPVCEKIIFTPVNAPMFSPHTLRRLMNTTGALVSPSYHGRGGHPVAVSGHIVPQLLSYRGGRGLRGAAAAMGERRTWVSVDDPGVCYTVHQSGPEPSMLNGGKDLFLSAELSLRTDIPVLDSRTKLLLLLIWKSRSVSTACEQMALSRSKAWAMLNTLEEALGAKLIERRHGGARGGQTTLSDRGLLFLREYQRLEEELRRHTHGRLDGLKALLR